MSMTSTHNNPTDSVSNSLGQVLISFKQSVIERFQIMAGNRLCSYHEYLAIPETSNVRHGDEANAVDQQFTRNMLEWLGFSPSDWTYNLPQAGTGKKLNRPDYKIRGSIGVAFIVEDKNSLTDFDSDEHLNQMRRYCLGTAGYAAWCNMRRLLAVRFVPGNALKYEILVDVSIEGLFGPQQFLSSEETNMQATNLALFQLLFSKDRFTKFSELAGKISVDAQTFEDKATSLDIPEAIDNFIDGSRQTLNHLKLAALSQILEARSRNKSITEKETILRREWTEAATDFGRKINYALISDPVLEAIAQLTPRLGELQSDEIRKISEVVKETRSKTIGMAKFSATLLHLYENWVERALRINSALLTQRFEAADPFKIVEAYQVWCEHQSDQEDVKPEVFAEQVAYVFFVRLLLVRVLEDKHILSPRLASDGGFLEWSQYIARHFEELDGIGVLNENFCNILTRKASNYYLHFFQQAVFDWFNPDDFLLIETLEFLCRYNFYNITSDIIGFTYEAYIERHARDRKGHFLTRHEVVDYMLDLLNYTGPLIIGRRILDPASGSGSFLVHAARRYRKALVTYFCNSRGLPDREENLQSDPDLRIEFASRYLQDLTTYFFGMELNPFACYLAEMNLLIQALDDLFVLQQAGDMQPIERFRIYNTDSLDLPREVLDHADLNGEANRISVPDRLSNRIADEAYPIKAMLNSYTEGFSYIVSNPPYVSSRQEEIDTKRFRNAEFYKAILSGDMNLYLLFLRLGLYYLAEYGQMIYIIPLTLLGDKSASAARKLLKTPPYSPSVVVRFYRGDILFPEVDQAVAIVRINRSQPASSIVVSGGTTVQEARVSQFSVPLDDVIESAPNNHIWQGNWLVAQSQESFDVWKNTKAVSANLTRSFGTLLDESFDRRQGDINATILNPLRLGTRNGSFSNGDIAIYKGEDVKTFAPMPVSPSDWAKPLQDDDNKKLSRGALRASQVLGQLKQIVGCEKGIVLRQVARLNTRERLIATWFKRKSDEPIAFTNELWRMLLKDNATEEYGKALLAVISSNIIAYLINLFSTNNHVGKDELGRVPIPDPQTLPVTQLANLANDILNERANLNEDFVIKYGAKLPEFDDGKVYLPPSSYLTATRVPKLSMSALVGRGEVKNNGPANGRVKALRARNMVVCTIDSANPNAAAYTEILELFLNEPERENDTWSQAQSWQLPDTIAARTWLNTYNSTSQQAQVSWDKFVSLQKRIDEIVADWYGFDASQRLTINEGLPWARRRRNHLQVSSETANHPDLSSNQLDVINNEISIGVTNRIPVTSSQIHAIGYDTTTHTLEVEFLIGEVWQYLSVPQDIYQKFETAPSKGKYYSQEIKGRYDSRKL
jgi:hypothetical protein